jgi:putative beta-lysine N-acetyltransferase
VISLADFQPGEVEQRLTGDGYEAEMVLSSANRRIQVTAYSGERLSDLAQHLIEEARERGLGKVFLKARASDADALAAGGLEHEATIEGYYNGEDAAVMAAFVNEERRQRPHLEEEEADLAAIQETQERSPRPLPPSYSTRIASEADADGLAGLYQEVFASYPYPIHDPAYLRATMASHIVYRLVFDGDDALVAAASAETAPELANAEMTDFATLPSQRGLGLAQRLLADLENDMAARGITNLYTIARARSFGMNRVFRSQGYHLTGTLVNNCHISGEFEDMHVWCKQIEAARSA